MLFTPENWGTPLQASPDPLLLSIKPKYLHASRTNLVKIDSPSKTALAINVLHLISIEMRHLNAFLDSSRVQHEGVLRWMCVVDLKTSFPIAAEWLKHLLSPSTDSGPVCPSAAGTREVSFSPTFSSSFVQWEAMDCCTGICGQPDVSSTREKRGLANDELEPLSFVVMLLSPQD